VTADLMAAIVNASITIAGGLYCWMLGTRKAGKAPGEDLRYDVWHERFGGPLRIMGPLIMAFGAIQVVIAFVRA